MANESTTGGGDPGKSSLSQWIKRYGLNLGVLVTVIIAVAGGLLYLGKLEERVNSAHDKISRIEYQIATLGQRLDDQIEAMNQRLSDQLAALDNAKRKAISEVRATIEIQKDPVVFVDGQLTSGYDLGVNTSNGLTDWVTVENGVISMKYPRGQQWGAVSITVGHPASPPRPGRDLSPYRSLLIEAKGEIGGESIFVGIKDNTDPDDGSETKVQLTDLTTDWQPYEISLARFRTADLTRLYVITEFVFERSPVSVFVRKIEFVR